MAYTKTTWVSGETALSADNMNNIEDGIEALDSRTNNYITTTSVSVSTSTTVDTKITEIEPGEGIWLIYGHVVFDTNSNGTRIASLSANDSLNITYAQSTKASDYGSTALIPLRLCTLENGESIKLIVKQTSNSTITVTGRLFAIKLI